MGTQGKTNFKVSGIELFYPYFESDLSLRFNQIVC